MLQMFIKKLQDCRQIDLMRPSWMSKATSLGLPKTAYAGRISAIVFSASTGLKAHAVSMRPFWHSSGLGAISPKMSAQSASSRRPSNFQHKQ